MNNFNVLYSDKPVMGIMLDKDVLKVLQFITHNIPSDKRISVLEQAIGLAPLMWGYLDKKPVCPIRLYNQKLKDLKGRHH